MGGLHSATGSLRLKSTVVSKQEENKKSTQKCTRFREGEEKEVEIKKKQRERYKIMHQGRALKKQKIPSSSARSLLVISSAFFFVLAPGVIMRRKIKGKKKRIQKQQVCKKNQKRDTTQ